jgi:methionyl-tRNA synthetase
MNQETLTALKGSIEKWEGIVDCEEEDNGGDNCDLCKAHYLNGKCHSCPVCLKSGRNYCHETPYDDWFQYAEENDTYRVFDKKSHELALAELDFLKSLLLENQS